LFSYFVIFFDKPFEIGDFIIVDTKMGVIEYIGLKTTRVRTLGGEQLIFPNHDLTNSRVHNYKRMEKRRILFTLGVIYETPPEKLRKVPGIVKGIIQELDDVSFDRGHFSSFGDFSLKFEFVYYINSADYLLYMDRNHEMNLKIFEAFSKEGIEFAYPTQVVHVPERK
jgi:small-conductance mechanosensitive channel